jgi:hypothetical protein
MVSMALIDHLCMEGNSPLLVEADTTNPDVWKAYSEEIETECCDLDDADGWIELLNLLDGKPDKTVVINTPARNNQAVKAYGETLSTTLKTLNRKMVTLWVINRQRDSLELLSQYLETMQNSEIAVVCNLHHGSEAKFELYNSSKIRELVETERHGKSLTFPDLADRVADDLNGKRLSIAKGVATLPLGNRVELERWRRECRKMFLEVVHD